MSSLATRIGRTCLKFHKHVIRNGFKRHNVGAMFHNGKFVKNVINPIGGMLNVVTPMNAQVKMFWSKKTYGPGNWFTYFGKGQVNGEVNIKVGKMGTTIEFDTDYNGKTHYLNEIKEYKNDEYEFRQEQKTNPEVQYKTDKDETVIKFFLSKIEK